jgi:hypothetical protein
MEYCTFTLSPLRYLDLSARRSTSNHYSLFWFQRPFFDNFLIRYIYNVRESHKHNYHDRTPLMNTNTYLIPCLLLHLPLQLYNTYRVHSCSYIFFIFLFFLFFFPLLFTSCSLNSFTCATQLNSPPFPEKHFFSVVS